MLEQAQIQEMKQAQSRGSVQLRSSVLDPAVNLMYHQMQKEIESLKAKLEQMKGDVAAHMFTPERYLFFFIFVDSWKIRLMNCSLRVIS